MVMVVGAFTIMDSIGSISNIFICDLHDWQQQQNKMKKFTTQEIRDLLNQVYKEEISFSRMVAILNEMVSEVEKKCVEDIPVRKFQNGDKVRIKDGFKPEEHMGVASFVREMYKYIGKDFNVDRVEGSYIISDGWAFDPDWLEPCVEELKEGDLAIFWDDEKEFAIIKPYGRPDGGEEDYFQHRDQNGFRWRNAIKFESKEQFNRFIKGEI